MGRNNFSLDIHVTLLDRQCQEKNGGTTFSKKQKLSSRARFIIQAMVSAAPIKTSLKQDSKKKERAWEIDVLRGIPIFVVVLYHFCWSFYFMPSLLSNSAEVLKANPTLNDFLSFITGILNSSLIQQYFAPLVGGLFIFICGVSTVFSKNNFRRAFLLMGSALVVTLATVAASIVAGENFLITWGVLHMMGFAILLYALLEKGSETFFHKQLSAIPLALIASVLFYISLILTSGYNPFTGAAFPSWPVSILRDDFFKRYLYEPSSFFTEPFGYCEGDMDFWPIFPYLGVCFLGIAFGKWVYLPRNNRSLFPNAMILKKALKPLCFIGSHTIWVYILHQPIFIAIFFLVFFGLGFRL